jgi:23S rRNA (cytosine1962-C5)-methyltransferase
MWNPQHYRLVDFGNGRKLEEFSGILVDRPSPAALHEIPKNPDAWREAIIAFDRHRFNDWEITQLPATWTVPYKSIHLLLKPTPFGHVGLFPEQAANWDWLENCLTAHAQILQRPAETAARTPYALNLFAYTGATSILLAKLGCHVTHVDASRPSVLWARENATLNQLDDAPIRWIVDDALKYARREVRRGRRYDIIALDPPSHGHGPKGERWEIERDLPELLVLCLQLLSDQPIALLLTGHSEEIDPEAMLHVAALEARFCAPGSLTYERATLHDEADRSLDAGYLLQWHAYPGNS